MINDKAVENRSPSPSMNSGDAEFELWEEMKRYDLNQLHKELASPEEMRRFSAAKELQIRGDESTFEYVSTLSKQDEASSREIAAFILGQLGIPNRPFRDRSIPILSNLLRHDIAPQVRAAAAGALGHLSSSEVFEWLEHASLDADANVRANVAFALGEVMDERAIRPLLRLTNDNDSNVVCWAVLGLRSLNIASVAVRDRFMEMLTDSSEDISDEVIFCLSKWKDKRVLPALLDALRRSEINLELIEAAGNLEDKQLLPTLQSLYENWQDQSPQILKDVIRKMNEVGK